MLVGTFPGISRNKIENSVETKVIWAKAQIEGVPKGRHFIGKVTIKGVKYDRLTPCEVKGHKVYSIVQGVEADEDGRGNQGKGQFLPFACPYSMGSSRVKVG